MSLIVNFAYSIIGFILLMGIVVFVHEFGHYYVARLCGVRAEIFSIGFGKKIFSRRDKTGCEWALSWLPFGGYVKFFGDKSAGSDADFSALEKLSDEEKKESFYYKNIWQKMAIVLAGPFANILLCFAILWFLFFFYGITHVKPYIQGVVKNMPAEQFGLTEGDKFLKVGGRVVDDASDVREQVMKSFGAIIPIEVERDRKIISLSLKPVMQKDVDGESIPIIGVIFSNKKEHITYHRHDVLASASGALNQSLMIVRLTGAFIKGLFTGHASPDQLSGPIKIGDIAGEALQQDSWLFFVQLIAMISISIGLVNLFPVPMLDGGHLMFYLFELIARRKPSEKFQEYAFKTGIVLVMSLMIFTVLNDLGIVRWWLS